jgi:diguanylate cyclase (GGDEF)-like protein
MVDVDYFKKLNDHDGHVAGDACLRTLGKILGAAVRKGDLAARYGGEEFALLLPGADREAALKVAERLRAAVEDLRIAHVAAPAGHVTVSIGVASLNPRPRMNPQMLVEMADAGLYAAKRGGRNTVSEQAPMQLAATG